jgi:hypothetical protein
MGFNSGFNGLNKESANWESVAPTALFDVCYNEYFQCFDRSSKLDFPVRNHWQNDREACRLLGGNAKYTGRIRRRSRTAYCFSLQGMNVEVLLYILPEGFQTCSAIRAGATTQGTVSSTITVVTKSKVAEPRSFVIYVQIQNFFCQATYECISWRWIPLALSINFKQCRQKAPSVGSFFRCHQDPYKVV